VVLLPEAKNPLYYRGKEVREVVLKPNEHFVLGLTTFTFVAEEAVPGFPSGELMYREAVTEEDLQGVAFANPDHRLEVLSRLPEVISRATETYQLCSSLVNMLLSAIPLAEVAAVVRAGPHPGRTLQAGHAADATDVEILHWDQRRIRGAGFRPSRRLVSEAVVRGQTVLHIWSRGGQTGSTGGKGSYPFRSGAGHSGPGEPQGGDRPISGEISPAVEGGQPNSDYTVQEGLDWAFCTPIRGKASAGWALYVAGSWPWLAAGAGLGPLVQMLRAEVKFTEIVGAIVASLRDLRELERRQGILGQFFPAGILERLLEEDSEVLLAPRETEVTVLFCDLRGFSKEAERHAADLLGLAGRVSQALQVMTRCILQEGGVIGDFQGDAAMGFWGWPVGTPGRIESVCRAALGIQRQFEKGNDVSAGPLVDFRVGIGIATGQAVAGKIGAENHVKITVIGPVVNLASRLEGMTRFFRVPILMDEATAHLIRREVPREVARVRRLARVQPYGMDRVIDVFELRLPEAEDPILADAHLALYERALDAFVAGRWSESFQLLHQLPPEDTGADLLTAHIVQHGRKPPSGWDGVIRLEAK
jgi:adenylate cyclase